MRKLAAILAFVGFTLGLVALPATVLAQTTSPTTSAANRSLNDEVSGPFTGTATFDFPTSTCPQSAAAEAHQAFDATYTSVKNGRTGSFHLDGCTSAPSEEQPLPFSGTFMLAAPNGATMNGTAVGTVTFLADRFHPLPNPALSFTLTPTGGTKKFANVGGVVNLTGTWVTSGVPPVPGPTSGSLAGALTH